MRYQRVDQALSACQAHLDSTESRNTEIEAYLVGYLLVTIYSAYEERVRELLLARIARITEDAAVSSFVDSAYARIVRGIRCSDLAGVLGHFGALLKKAFQDNVNNTAAQVAYDNIINNRHSLAHRSGTNMTFAEVQKDYVASQSVLENLGTSLGLSCDELATFS